jgi:hypothetical protein
MMTKDRISKISNGLRAFNQTGQNVFVDFHPRGPANILHYYPKPEEPVWKTHKLDRFFQKWIPFYAWYRNTEREEYEKKVRYLHIKASKKYMEQVLAPRKKYNGYLEENQKYRRKENIYRHELVHIRPWNLNQLWNEGRNV